MGRSGDPSGPPPRVRETVSRAAAEDAAENRAQKRALTGDDEEDDDDEDYPGLESMDSEDEGLDGDVNLSSESDRDHWTFQGEQLVRHHKQERHKMFVPTDANCPLPLKYLDVQRYTKTDFDHASDMDGNRPGTQIIVLLVGYNNISHPQTCSRSRV